jgi:hypothetical protein
LRVSANSAQVGSTGRIQEAVDLVNPNGTIDVFSGHYSEQALARDPFSGLAGSTNFGVVIAKNGLTIQGVDDSGAAITNRSGILATITAAIRTVVTVQRVGPRFGIAANALLVAQPIRKSSTAYCTKDGLLGSLAIVAQSSTSFSAIDAVSAAFATKTRPISNAHAMSG